MRAESNSWPRRLPDAPSGSVSGGYRPALDGVRAAAVLAVIVYHVGGRMRGGFLGVDVFFVLSGYLITTLLLRERAAAGAISLGGFWLRRARRLLPALLILVAACAIVAAATTPIAELAARRDEMLSTLGYFANWHFIATDASYFGDFIGASPLRHMWSLAIEEQFYIVWPLMLVGVLWLARGRRGVLLVVVAVAAATSAVVMAMTYDVTNPSRAYYGTESHASPLLVGAALALLLNLRPELLSGSRARRMAGWIWPVVIGVIALAVVALGDQDASYYRGGLLVFALVVAVALWIIEAIPQSLPARFISLRPVAWIGMISYGLYLWHWPLLVWLGEPGQRSTVPVALAVLGVSFAAATLSFYVVERPVRRSQVPWIGSSRLRLVAGLAAMFALVATTAVWATRISPSERIATQVSDTSDAECPAGSPAVGGYSWCLLAAPAGPDAPTIATVGDSTSRALTPGLNRLASERGWGYVQAGQGGCSVLGLALVDVADDAELRAQGQACAAAIPMVLDRVAADFHPDLWIVSDYFLLNEVVPPDGGPVLERGDPRRDELLTDELASTLDVLTANGAEVAILEVLPSAPPIECASETTPECSASSHTLADEPTARANAIIGSAADKAGTGVTVVSIADLVCPGSACEVASEGTLIRYDTLHFTTRFSEQVAPAIVERAGSDEEITEKP